jgi:hypothetical protein
LVFAPPDRLLDGEEADLGLIAKSVFSAGGCSLDPELDDLLEPVGSRIRSSTPYALPQSGGASAWVPS